MNIAYLLTPKHRVAYLYDDNTIRQGLEKLRHHGRSAVPVINRKGRYVGTVSEGDFLWRLLPDESAPCPCSVKELERLHVRDILRENPSVRITASVDELLDTIVRQNFVPVVDDLNSFIGIVTRQDIIRCLAEEKGASPTLRKIV
ncbi:CBS domain-containing protein [uncultured Oscillibacter sp.]|uniref:CBS domain-containing protein n=1 Tax=uncultured Oscillibacter sp. TaxID=876091 RepID=UPI002628285B|nr:CBS domain-containing protein [uncultured Oscillibacter sp.]